MNGEWRRVRLGDVLVESRERVPVERSASYPVAGVKIAGGGLFWREMLPGSATKYDALYRLHEGQLVYRKLTAWEGPITVVPPDFEGAYVSAEFPTFTFDQSKLLPDFMSVVCQQPSLHNDMKALSSGTAERRNRLTPSDLLKIEISLPPIAEQKRVVRAAAIVDRAVAAHERHAENAFTALDVAREHLLLTEGEWEDLPSTWARCRLSDVADIRSGITKGRKTSGAMRDAAFIRAANVQDGFLDLGEVKTLAVSEEEHERFALATNDILMTEGGNAEHVGRGWLWKGQEPGAVCQNHVFRVRIRQEGALPRFLAYAIGASPARTYCFESAKKTTNLASINKTQVSELQVPVPPVGVQQDILCKLDALRRVGIAEHEASVRLARLRDSLIDELLTGVQAASEPALVS